MGICKKCNCALPPGFIENGTICVFCERDVTTIHYGDKSASKMELIKEYDIFLKMVKEKNSILKRAVKGDMSGIPEKLIIE
jgi:hypothetical protein